MNVRTLCLAILYFQNATGYEIRKLSTEGKYSHFVDASFGSIYPALNKLESEGLVTCEHEVEPGKPNRKVYTITDTGREEFLDALTETPSRDIFRSEFLLVAMCAEFLPRPVVQKAIQTHTEHLEGELELLRGFAEDPTGTKGIRWAAKYGIACKTLSLNFLKEERQVLEEMTATKLPLGKEAAE